MKIFKKVVGSIYKKISQLLRCNYWLKDFFTPYLMFDFLILVNVCNASQYFMMLYL